jgi:hypothetical protein
LIASSFALAASGTTAIAERLQDAHDAGGAISTGTVRAAVQEALRSATAGTIARARFSNTRS